MPRVGPVSHEDRLTLVEHLDELRTRLIVSLVVLGVAFALCFWQNHLILDVINKPLPDGRDHPITFGVAEPFTTTVTVSAYAAILISLPLILYQLYAFVLPAFKPQERKVALPLLMLIPVLFIAGVVFGYFVVLPAATKFLLNFNDTQFNIQVRAKDYYSFVSMTLIAMGLVFQVPVGILAITRLGITTPEQLAKNRPLRVGDHRRGRRGAARHRPGLDADRDGAAAAALRGQPGARALPRAALARPRAPAPESPPGRLPAKRHRGTLRRRAL